MIKKKKPEVSLKNGWKFTPIVNMYIKCGECKEVKPTVFWKAEWDGSKYICKGCYDGK